jgi:signal transduction histidine kinase/YHS domain-containing protein
MLVLVSVLLGASAAANWWLFQRVLAPVRRLSVSADRLAQGDLHALEGQCGGIREIGALQHTMASMAGHVQRAQTESRTYRHALTDGQEAERGRIAHELHDDTVQSLIAIAQSLDLAARWMASDPERARTVLTTARSQAVDSVDNLRRLIADLRPPALEELGVAAALAMLAKEAHAAHVEVRVTGNALRLEGAAELALFRIAQEAVRNADQHANANRIVLDLDFQARSIHLTIQDDGIGFAAPAALEALAHERHFGLLGMRERVEQLDGTLTLTSRPGSGTRIRVELPLDAGPQPSERVRDPVCGADIEPERAFGSTDYDGTRYYFCCPVCQGAFQREPLAYVGR